MTFSLSVSVELVKTVAIEPHINYLRSVELNDKVSRVFATPKIGTEGKGGERKNRFETERDRTPLERKKKTKKMRKRATEKE